MALCEGDIQRYFQKGAPAGRTAIERKRRLWKSKTRPSITKLAADAEFKAALRSAASTAEMQAAQAEIAFEGYMRPALEECGRRSFTLPLSLGVVLDSLVHGSWEKVAARVRASTAHEKEWVTEYVRKRDAWLKSALRLAKTSYRTAFFLAQIADENWELALPVRVNGHLLSETALQDRALVAAATGKLPLPVRPELPFEDPAARTAEVSAPTQPRSYDGPADAIPPETAGPPDASSIGLDDIEDAVYAAAEQYDRVEAMVKTVVERNDSARSLWTAAAGTLWQTVWGIIGFLTGMPWKIWLAVAIVAAALVVGYLYRQAIVERVGKLGQ